MLSCARQPATEYCAACFTGRYPLPIRTSRTKLDMESGDANSNISGQSDRTAALITTSGTR